MELGLIPFPNSTRFTSIPCSSKNPDLLINSIQSFITLMNKHHAILSKAIENWEAHFGATITKTYQSRPDLSPDSKMKERNLIYSIHGTSPAHPHPTRADILASAKPLADTVKTKLSLPVSQAFEELTGSVAELNFDDVKQPK